MNRRHSLLTALEPELSVVVEACAGSGKTWLLVSRLLRLLLAGVAPGAILAITYTRKAAREIEERLDDWLRLLASVDDDRARAFLEERGLDHTAAVAALPAARGLLERVLGASPGLTITTFHGWFARLLQGAPLSSGLAGYTLVERDSDLLDEAWAMLARQCARAPDSPEALSLLWLYAEVGAANTRNLLTRFVVRRAEWHAWRGEGADDSQAVAERLREVFDLAPGSGALATFADDPAVREQMCEFAELLICNGTATDVGAGDALGLAWRDAAMAAHARLSSAASALLTQKGELKSRKWTKALEGRLGARTERFLQLHERLGQTVQAVKASMTEEAAFAFNCHGIKAGQGLLDCLDRLKRQRQLMDFGDLEWHADRLLRDETEAAYLQAKLDARYKHVLLDEFQDTNPLQWRILRAWFDAYGDDGALPRVFLVGDPKQSIYRFRRAEPRIFSAARTYLEERFGAVALAADATRRNAPAVVEVLNKLFGAEPLFTDFRPQTTFAAGVPGRVEAWPLCANGKGEDEALASPAAAMRNPLTTPLVLEEDVRRQREAAQLVAGIQDVVSRWRVREGSADRPADYGDILILTRRRTRLVEYERALRGAGIPYVNASRGGLLQTLEAADLLALLRCLSSRTDTLSLAHALRSPIFSLGDEDLLSLAATGPGRWLVRLRELSTQPDASGALQRAGKLLGYWRELATRLPVHDLLDRIYGEGEVMGRYRAAVQAGQWPGVLANLEAFLAVALETDAGRYPSLSRFLDELGAFAQGGDDAPDEGEIALEAGQGRVRILTIHGAKGLEAPVVWLIDAHNTHRLPENYGVLLDWPPEADSPAHFSLLSDTAGRGRRRAHLLEAEAQAREREELNLLYVALTRAKQYFFLSGIEPARRSERSSWYDRVVSAISGLGGEQGKASQAWGAEGVWLDQPHALPEQPPCPAEQAALPGALRLPPTPVGERRAPSSQGQRFGTLLHQALEWLTEIPGRDPFAAPVPPEVQRQAAQLFQAPRLRRFFDAGCYRSAANELEFVLPDGGVGRIDRLVDLPEAVWVLDYKTGTPDPDLLAAYRRQLEGYRTAVRQLYPGRVVRCALVFAQGELLELNAEPDSGESGLFAPSAME